MESAFRRGEVVPRESKKVPLRVTLLGENYEVLGDVDPIYANEIVSYVNNQMNLIAKTSPDLLTSSTKSKVAILTCLNLAEELFKERQYWSKKTQKLTEVLEKALKKQIPIKKEMIPKKK